MSITLPILLSKLLFFFNVDVSKPKLERVVYELCTKDNNFMIIVILEDPGDYE